MAGHCLEDRIQKELMNIWIFCLHILRSILELLILFIKAILYGHKKMDERYLLLLLFVISRSIIESEHLTLVYSWFPALLGMAMFDSQKTKTEMRV